MATISWQDPVSITDTRISGIAFSCNAVLRMLYAAQEPQSVHDEQIKKDQKLASLENKVAELDSQNAAMSLELKKLQATVNLQTRAPAVTCLMHLFIGCIPKLTYCTGSSVSTDTATCTSWIPPVTVTRCHDPPTKYPLFDIPPHTDRLSDLSTDAQKWFLQQLTTA